MEDVGVTDTDDELLVRVVEIVVEVTVVDAGKVCGVAYSTPYAPAYEPT